MITESKVMELFCIVDDLASLIFNFVSFLMPTMSQYTLKPAWSAVSPCFNQINSINYTYHNTFP